MRKRFSPLVCLLVAAAFAAGQASESSSRYQVAGTPTELGLAGYAKVLCSAVFVSLRDPDEAFRNSGYWMMPNDQQEGNTYTIDREKKTVRVTRGGTSENGEVVWRPGLHHTSARP